MDAHADLDHASNPNERRRLALAEIDNAPFSWYHVRAILVAGVGFFTDSYDLFTASLLSTMVGIVYHGGALSLPNDTAIKVSSNVGNIVGQVVFGILADLIGRKRMYGVELMIMIAATLAQAMVGEGPGQSIVGALIFWRVILGIGIGGDYPLSSVITSEFASTKWRGAMMGAVFSMQGFGQMAGALVMIFLVLGFKGSLSSAATYATCHGECAVAVDKMWRALIGIGAVPAVIALYFRLTIPETPRYTLDIARDTEKAKEDVEAYMAGRHERRPNDVIRAQALEHNNEALTVPKAGYSDFIHYFSNWKNGLVLLGTAGSWFMVDVAFYGLSLNSTTVLTAIGYGTGPTVYKILYNVAAGNCILICAGAIPGYWTTVATCDTIGRKTIQLGGFCILTVLFIIWGFDYNHLKPHGHLALYVVVQYFFQFGPNATTFIIPGELFPTRYRSSAHGFSAACGKVGSIVGQAGIARLRTRGASKANANPWQNHVMQIYSLFMFLGIFTTLLVPETKRKTLEELSGEEFVETVQEPVVSSKETNLSNAGSSDETKDLKATV